jgi:hypothetical protein
MLYVVGLEAQLSMIPRRRKPLNKLGATHNPQKSSAFLVLNKHLIVKLSILRSSF